MKVNKANVTNTDIWIHDPLGDGLQVKNIQLTRRTIHDAVTSVSNYYPFGLKMKYTGGNIGPAGDYRYGYQGEFAEYDEETEFNHFELRDYDPVIGRWMNVDPKRVGFSPYIGMANNPLSLVDPDGGSPGYKDQNGNTAWFDTDYGDSFAGENGQQWTKVTNNIDHWNAMNFGDMSLDQVEFLHKYEWFNNILEGFSEGWTVFGLGDIDLSTREGKPRQAIDLAEWSMTPIGDSYTDLIDKVLRPMLQPQGNDNPIDPPVSPADTTYGESYLRHGSWKRDVFINGQYHGVQRNSGDIYPNYP